MQKHIIPIRIYYEDTDAGGVVYHANYLKFAERGRTEFLRATGFENRKLSEDEGIIFVVRHIDIHYLKPAFLDDSLIMVSTIKEIKNSSFIMNQRVYRPKKNAEHSKNHASKAQDEDIESMEHLCDMHVVLVCVDAKKLTPVRLPEDVKTAFAAYTEEEKK
ncbi:MAG: YbgC/FadM family acyl-CoA thioesterase [Alphaproteobacteria bacterium]|nr:YbgC/FadM family acyl-CoA thioesterase [Alphaproteobacteria bacterium]